MLYSFDVFDTVITRIIVMPQGIFALILSFYGYLPNNENGRE